MGGNLHHDEGVVWNPMSLNPPLRHRPCDVDQALCFTSLPSSTLNGSQGNNPVCTRQVGNLAFFSMKEA
jgi:hypothetical protein